jgi:hypothetical protein
MTLTVGIELQQKETDEIYSTVANVDLSRGGVGGTFSNELFKSCTLVRGRLPLSRKWLTGYMSFQCHDK